MILADNRISPTAHYTGYVWARNGLSHPELSTTEGRILFDSLQPFMLASRGLGSATLESYLLARHRAIDARLERAIEAGEVSQVIEVAAGLSPRGWRFANRYGERLVYVEADLPGMAARKRAALERMGSLGERHRVREVDALRDDDGPGSLASVVAELDPEPGAGHHHRGTARVSEHRRGRPDSGAGSPRRWADFHVAATSRTCTWEARSRRRCKAFRLLLSAFVRGRVYLHFDDAAEAEAALRAAGFAAARITPAVDVTDAGRDAGARLAHILEASTR